MDRELLVEIGVEEIPAAWLPGLTAQLADRLRARLADIGLKVENPVEAHSTPRRLTAVVAELVDRQEDREEKVMGPPVSAGMTPDGHPTPAVLGFARKNEVGFDALTQEDTPKGRYFVFLKKLRGHATVDVLPDVLTKVLRDLTFAKEMRWDAHLEDGKGELTFGRPIRWLLFLYGGRVVPFTIARSAGASSPRVQDVSSGAVTYGHRFLATSGRAGRAIKVRSFDEYKKRLGEQFVILARSDRRDRIVRDLDAQARRLGGRVMIHQHPQTERLIDEVPDLVEYPAVVAGAFGAEFLALPSEVLTTTLIHHQHAFPVIGQNGALMPAFLAVTNTQSSNDRAIATNAERVVTARLRDARFFWDADRKVGLDARLDRLETVLFHKQLGSYRQKAERIEKLARWIATEVFGQAADVADQAALAAKLCKADLATDMVREFPELQGQMGGVYAREAGQPESVWKAIYHHYLPIAVEENAAPTPEQLGQARVTWACVSLADKLDTLSGLFLKAGERPTGSRDPFGLRRAAQGVMKILADEKTLPASFDLRDALHQAMSGYGDVQGETDALAPFMDFMKERLTHLLQRRGVSVGVARAVEADWHHPARALQKAAALSTELAKTTSELLALAELYKRAANITKGVDASFDERMRARLTDKTELALIEFLVTVEGDIARSLGSGDYAAAIGALVRLRQPVDQFFTNVMVMVEDPDLKAARLGLLTRLRNLIDYHFGDLSQLGANS